MLASFLVVGLGGCGGPPQIGVDEESFKSVDALYTAISLRDQKLVDRCDGRLRELKDGKKLPEAAGTSLDAIIVKARGGKWEDAQTRLGEFMRGQRRDK